MAVSSPIIGVFADAVYREEETHLAVGDLLLLYTDGIMEARRDSSMLGEQGIADFVRESYALATGELPAKLLQHAVNHAGGVLNDDAVVLTIRRRRRDSGDEKGDLHGAGVR